MNECFFVSDLHGMMSRYETLFRMIRLEKPDFVLMGGDLLPHRSIRGREGFDNIDDFGKDFLFSKFRKLRMQMDCAYPEIFLIPGNDDRKENLSFLPQGEAEGLWFNLNQRCKIIGKYRFYGYAYVPPTPFRLKDWEKYDVSRYVDPGCLSPLEGVRTGPADGDPEWDTIEKDLNVLCGNDDLNHSIFLFHSPPYQCKLDRAALDGQMYDHVPLDVHVGSIAIQRFIELRQPMVTLHGHVHESTRLTGSWQEQFGRTYAFNAAHDGTELSLVVFDLQHPDQAVRRLL
jgi:Icc-related predicted phosphoesterase